jgi:leader peptidase (prepilin peptidase) / N-methyltransferase
MPLSLVPVEFWLLSFGMLGAILGSYINMAAYRLPRNISTVTRTRSFCPKCDHQLFWYDNIPILSYLLLLGKCRYCRAGIPRRYLLTEIIVATLFLAATYQFFGLNPALTWFPSFTGRQPWILFVVQLFLIADLVLLAVVDLEVWLIPIETTLPWALIGLLIAPVFPELHGAATSWLSVTTYVTGATRINAAIDSFMGLVIGAGILWTIGFLVTLLTYYYFRIKGRKDRPLEGMGLGDVHLMAMIGAMLGWKAALATLMLGVFIGAATGILKIMYENRRRSALGDAYKAWQPEFEMPPVPADSQPKTPRFWNLLWMGILVLLVSAYLLWQAGVTFGYGLTPTFEELRQGLPPAGLSFPVDFRAFPLYLMLLLGALLILACFFLNHLANIDMLPQGNIEENDEGEQKEVLQGNYVPFGPSLAAAGLIVAFYEPLIRNFAYWWFALNHTGPFPPLPWNVLGF